jgi:hypothetical protein
MVWLKMCVLCSGRRAVEENRPKVSTKGVRRAADQGGESPYTHITWPALSRFPTMGFLMIGHAMRGRHPSSSRRVFDRLRSACAGEKGGKGGGLSRGKVGGYGRPGASVEERQLRRDAADEARAKQGMQSGEIQLLSANGTYQVSGLLTTRVTDDQGTKSHRTSLSLLPPSSLYRFQAEKGVLPGHAIAGLASGTGAAVVARAEFLVQGFGGPIPLGEVSVAAATMAQDCSRLEAPMPRWGVSGGAAARGVEGVVMRMRRRRMRMRMRMTMRMRMMRRMRMVMIMMIDAWPCVQAVVVLSLGSCPLGKVMEVGPCQGRGSDESSFRLS